MIGGSSGIGLETARLARAEGADVVLTGCNPERLQYAALELDALSSAAFDATHFDRLERFFDELPTPVDRVMVTAGGPSYARLTDIDFEQARRNVDQHLWLPLHVARNAAAKVRPGGTLLFISGTGGRRPAVGMALSSTFTAAPPALTRVLALELAPVRVNLIRARFRRHTTVGDTARRPTRRASRPAHDEVREALRPTASAADGSLHRRAPRFNVGSVRVSHPMRALRRYGAVQRPHAGLKTETLTSKTCRNSTARCALVFREPLHS